MMDENDYELISVDMVTPAWGKRISSRGLLRTHGWGTCQGPAHPENGKPICCIHNPSSHHMVTWPQNWRGDLGIMERTCSHGDGHPDPDDLAVRITRWAGAHDCDECCIPAAKDE